MTAITIAKPMPGMAPRTATPTKQTMDNQNSQRWIRKIRDRSLTSIKPSAEEMTTAAMRLQEECGVDPGAIKSKSATAIAPTIPANCVRAPAASATGVREELLLIGKPWKNPAARFAIPSPNNFDRDRPSY